MRTEFGEFRAIAYTSAINPEMHLALVLGDVDANPSTLVRVHANCVLRRYLRFLRLRLPEADSRLARPEVARGRGRRAGVPASEWTRFANPA